MKSLKVLFLVSIVLLGRSLGHAQTTPYVWVADTMQRVMIDETPGKNRVARIWAAKGEYEPVQIVISEANKDLTDIKISVSDLKGTSSSIERKHIKVWREHYVRVEKSSPNAGPPNPPIGSGLYPDALIPLTSSGIPIANLPRDFRAVKKGENQPYWIDIFIPRNTPAGEYKGICNIQSSQGIDQIDIHLTVWNFELPHRPSLRSMFGVWENYTNSTEVMLKHRLMPWNLDKKNIEYYDQNFGINVLETGQWSGANMEIPHMSPAPSPQEWAKIEESFPKEFKGMLYNYTADEVWDVKKILPSLREWGKNMHIGSSIKNLVTMPPIPELYDDGTGRPAVDIWVLLPFQAQNIDNKEGIKYVMEAGCEVWSYTALMWENYSPKWMADFSPVNYRIQAWINQIFDFTGILYWRVDLWSKDPWVSFGKENKHPGDGMLVYPGDPVGIINGVVPSMRLKYLRESVEDYEYIEILKSMGEEKFALNTIQLIARDWKDWSHDGESLMQSRKILGDRIHYLKSKQLNNEGTSLTN